MREGGVQPLAFFKRLPETVIAVIEIAPHILKGITESAELILRLALDFEIQIVIEDLVRCLCQDPDGLFDLSAAVDLHSCPEAQR